MKNQAYREDETSAESGNEIDILKMITITQNLLSDLIESQGTQCQSIFNSIDVPSISLQAYLRRLHKYSHFSPQCLVIAIIYIDRYNMAQADFSLNWNNVHRMLLTCLMLAVKFHDDVYFDNITFQRGGGISAAQLMKFQVQVFQKLGFNTFVQVEQYEALMQRLCSVYNEQQQP